MVSNKEDFEEDNHRGNNWALPWWHLVAERPAGEGMQMPSSEILGHIWLWEDMGCRAVIVLGAQSGSPENQRVLMGVHTCCGRHPGEL